MGGATTTMKAMLDGAVVVGETETWRGEEAVLEKKGGEEELKFPKMQVKTHHKYPQIRPIPSGPQILVGGPFVICALRSDNKLILICVRAN